MPSQIANSPGSILLIGAGPGDAELMTVKAVRALQTADVVLFDALVSDAVLAHARPDALKISVGKKGHGPSCKQSDICRLIVDYAQEGKIVARLKGGDPMVFGRASEEIEAARAAGIAIQVIPGITTAQAAAAALGVSLTERHLSRRLQYVTGHDHKGGLPTDVDWRALADPHATTVIYMPKKTLAEFAATVAAHGLPADTPAVAVMNVSLPTQAELRGTLATLPEMVANAGFEGPVVVIIGRAMGSNSAPFPAPGFGL